MAQWDSANFNRFILETEDDHGSPVNEELTQQTRQNIVGLLLLMLDTGTAGTATHDPPNDATGWIYCNGSSFSTDEHNGRSVLFTSGNAKGLFYCVDDTIATALQCNGDNLYAAGVRSGDTFKVLYDLINSTLGHSHDGTDSRLVATPNIGDGTLVPTKLKSTCHAGGSGNLSWATVLSVSIQMADYSFFPNVYVERQDCVWMTGYSAWVNGCDGRFGLRNNCVGESSNYQYRYRYLHASGPASMYIVKNRKTGLIDHVWFAGDPPSGSGRPIVLVDEFDEQIDMEPYEEVLITDVDPGMIERVVEVSLAEGKLYHEVLNDHFSVKDGVLSEDA